MQATLLLDLVLIMSSVIFTFFAGAYIGYSYRDGEPIDLPDGFIVTDENEFKSYLLNKHLIKNMMLDEPEIPEASNVGGESNGVICTR